MKIYKSNYVFSIIYSVIGIEIFLKVYTIFYNAFIFENNTFSYKAILNLLVMILYILFWIFIPFGINYIYKKYFIVYKEMEKMKKYSFEKNKQEFEKIVEDFSPGEINFISDNKFNEVKDIALTIMGLELKNKIRIENKKIKLANDDLNYYDKDLKKSEKFIIDNIKKGKVYFNINNPKFKELCIQESLEDGLMSTKQDRKIEHDNKIIKIDIIVSLTLMVFILVWFAYRLNSVLKNLFIIMSSFFIASMLCVVLSSYFIVKYYNYFKNIYEKVLVRTQIGESKYEKLNKLKQYMTYLENESEISSWKYYNFYNLLFDFDYNKLKEILELVDISYCENKM